MTLNAVAVELLIEKGGFEPRVALGIAEAIETSMTQAQIVTVPILDARLQELRADMRSSLQQLEIKIERSKAELVRWVFLVMLGNVALSTGATAILNAFQHSR
jgi:hypothetical protein